jgi:hypothetical protein
LPTGGAALSHEHVVAVVEQKLHLHYPRAVLDVELGERALLLDLENVTHDLHLVQLGAVLHSRVARAVLRCIL